MVPLDPAVVGIIGPRLDAGHVAVRPAAVFFQMVRKGSSRVAYRSDAPRSAALLRSRTSVRPLGSASGLMRRPAR